MEWPSLLVIVSSSLLFFAKTTASLTVNYVKPLVNMTASPCPNEHRLCLTLGEYTSNSDVYFVNNTIFYFYPGNHRLEDSLILENLHNFSFLGLPNGDQIVNVSVDSLASITWKELWNIEISSIRFTLNDHFTFIMKFERSQIVHLSNVSIFGNGYSGCSSVLIQESTVFINNSMFTKISGFLGAAVMMEASNVTFRGNNAFVNNTAISGGSIYLSESRLTFNRTSLFLNNTSKVVKYKAVLRPSLCYSRDIVDKFNNGSGGAIFCRTSYLRFYEHSNFTGNSADLSGGAIVMAAGALTTQGFASFDRNRASLRGGAMFLYNINSKISGTLYLKYNEARGAHGYGGAMCILKGELIIRGDTLFDGNCAKIGGGALYISLSAKVIFYGTNSAIIRRGEVYTNKSKANKCFNCTIPSITFLNNTADLGGSILCRKECEAGFFGTVYFNYSAGSAIYLSKRSSITFTGDTYFYRNIGDYGGAIRCHDSNYTTLSGMVYFEDNTAYRDGGAMFFTETFKLIFKPKHDTFNNSIIFLNNTARYGGSIFCWKECEVELFGTVYFNHSAGSAIYLGKRSSISFTGDTYFYRNSGYRGGAIQCHDDNYITLSGTVYFEDNTAYWGGAMFLRGTSKLVFKPKLNIFFISNHANDSGGALYFRDSQCSLESTVECFITIDGPISSLSSISLHFENNSAGFTGSILYGGQFDKCRLFFKTINTDLSVCQVPPSYSNNALETLKNISTIDSEVYELNINDTILVSSPAGKIRFCEVDDKGVLNTFTEMKVYPGQQLDISLIAFGQTEYPVRTTVFWEKDIDHMYNRISEYRLSPPSRTLESSCTIVSFQFYSRDLDLSAEFKLYPENPCQNLFEGLTLSINVLDCPIGFNLSLRYSRCVCDKKLKMLTQNCYIGRNSESVERMKNSFWIYKATNESLLLHESRCPLDYCKDKPEHNISLSDPSVQCDFNRNGSVCGKCQKNFSLALGSLHCIPCDNKHTALILFFTTAGVALIAVVFLLRLTVSIGTLSGLFFYANIVQANHQAFFPRATINFFTVFISWLNLDLGIETCFYDGMDIYAYSWFQFLFPFYVWFLVGCIILAGRYSQFIAKHLGQNPVAVLATLLLMSYGKILSAVIVPLSWTYLTYYTASNETQTVVWLFDASIDFFREPKHIALGLFAITSLVVFVLPFILLLLFGHWLQGCSNWWILSWLNKLKPFMDAYHAPYKKHARYWTGLLIISRLVLFIIFANDSESVNIAAVSSVSVALLAIRFRVYEHFYNDILESSFILNLGIFSVATFYLKEKSENASNSQLILSSISVGIAFITFVGILIFHISLVLKSSTIWKVYMFPFIQKSFLLSKILMITPVTKDKNTKGDKDVAELQVLPTSTEIDVDLREPLLESQAAD